MEDKWKERLRNVNTNDDLFLKTDELPRSKLTAYLRHFFSKHNFSIFCWKYHVIQHYAASCGELDLQRLKVQ
jgi:hypothetical protein